MITKIKKICKTFAMLYIKKIVQYIESKRLRDLIYTTLG